MAKTKGEILASRAMDHGASAWGASLPHRGVALSPELGLAYALGRGSGAAPIELTTALAPGAKVVAGPQHAINRALHVIRGGRSAEATLADAPLEAAPMTAAEAQALVLRLVPAWMSEAWIYSALEALVGPSALLASMAEGMERLEPREWHGPGSKAACIALYGMMLRALPGEVAPVRARLEALFTKVEAAVGPPANLGVMLFGRRGIERYGYKYSSVYKSFGTSSADDPSTPLDLVFCHDDGAWIAAQSAALWKAVGYRPQKWMTEPPPGRLLFLAGDAMFESELAVVEKYPGTMQAAAFEAYRDFRSPLAIRCIEVLAGPKSKVKKQADAWLAAHATG